MKHNFRVNPLRTAGLILIFFGIGFIVEYTDVHEAHYLLRGVMVLCAAVVLIVLDRPLLKWVTRREINNAQIGPIPLAVVIYLVVGLILILIVGLALLL